MTSKCEKRRKRKWETKKRKQVYKYSGSRKKPAQQMRGGIARGFLNATHRNITLRRSRFDRECSTPNNDATQVLSPLGAATLQNGTKNTVLPKQTNRLAKHGQHVPSSSTRNAKLFPFPPRIQLRSLAGLEWRSVSFGCPAFRHALIAFHSASAAHACWRLKTPKRSRSSHWHQEKPRDFSVVLILSVTKVN